MLCRFFRYRQEFDVRPFDDLNFFCFFFRKWFDNHGIIYNIFFRLMDLSQFLYIISEDFLRRCKSSLNRCCSCTFRTYKINLCCRVSCTAFEVTVGSTYRNSLCSRCLADSTAWSAGNLQNSYTCINEHVKVSVTEKFFICLSGSDTAGTAYIVIYMSSLKYKCCFCNICIACVCTTSDEYLLNRLSFHIFQRNNIIRLMRT